ncbi:MAG: hypothetical protein UH071_04340, partial [Paludibacteraceae bacterium]|nr:hypothetical protein [Paludibacteraceae bacterium]
MKKIAASALIFGSWGGANAQNEVKKFLISAESDVVCPHEGVILKASLATTTSIIWQKKENGVWVNASDEGAQLKPDVPFIYEMDEDDVEFRAIGKNGNEIVAESNTYKVAMGTDCVPECHTSSTGDFINGTDFNKLPQYESLEKPSIPQQIESFFPEYNVGFENLYSNYKVTKDLTQTFDGKLPIKDGGRHENSYYVFTNNLSQTHPFRYIYPCKIFHGKDYRLVMRMYVMRKNASCKATNAALKLETEQGQQTTDRAKIIIVDDKEDKIIREKYITKDYGLVDFDLSDNSLVNKLLRVDVTFYGHFPDDKYDPITGEYNGLENWVLKPFFQQFDGCFTVAIDYLSAEVENICLSPKLQCNGEMVTATAFGFGDDVTYTWYEEKSPNSNQWLKLPLYGKGDKYRELPINVDFVGSKKYKVVVQKGEGKKDSELSFYVYGKDCDPIWPNEIVGDAMVCAPKSDNIYYVDPVSEDATVFYRWKLITPSKKEVYNNTVYEGANIQEDQKTKGASVRVIFPAVAEHGKYTLEAQVVRRTVVDGATVENPIGTPIQKIIDVHNTPELKLTLASSPNNVFEGTSESDKIICPSDIKNKYIANVEVTNKEGSHKYNYTWTGATSSTKTSTTAELSWDRTKACNGTLKSHTVSVTAEIDGVGCPADISKTYKFETPEDPTIDCSKIDGIVYPLGEKEKTMTIDLPIPTYSAGCDPDPKMTIDVVVKDLEGTVLKGTNQSRTISFSVSQLSTINKKVVAPAGTIELKYTITDGCGKSDFCVAIDSVKDVTPPNVNCDLIKNYTAHLKNQNGCVAVPGDFPTELPKLSEPKLPDLNGVDGTLIGEYLGRREVEDRPSEIPSIFDKKKGLNDPYKKGVTWILWAFSDKSGNTKFCLQQISVIDDKAPNVTCPNVDLGSIDVDTLTCSLKPSSVIAKLKEVAKLPYGFDECSSTPTDSLVPTLYYRVPKDGDDLIEIKDGQMDDPIFVTGIKYEMVWVFKKIKGHYVDESVSVECAVPFMAEDQDAPEFDCSSLINIMVFPNYTTNNGITYDNYASGAGQSSNNPDKVYTLSKYFDEGYLSMHEDVQDVCGGEVTVEVTVTDHKGKTTKIKTLDEFKKFKFEGDASGKDARTYTVRYKFTDQRFNTKECEQLISVVRNAPPVPDCPSTPTVLYTDDKCNAIFDMSLSKIPTAEVKYYHATRYGYCQNAGPGPGAGPGMGGPGAANDCSKMTPVTTKNPGNVKMTFEEFPTLSASKSGFVTINVYPDSVRLYDATGKVTTVKNPLDAEDDMVVTKDVIFRTFLANGKACNCEEGVVYG